MPQVFHSPYGMRQMPGWAGYQRYYRNLGAGQGGSYAPRTATQMSGTTGQMRTMSTNEQPDFSQTPEAGGHWWPQPAFQGHTGISVEPTPIPQPPQPAPSPSPSPSPSTPPIYDPIYPWLGNLTPIDQSWFQSLTPEEQSLLLGNMPAGPVGGGYPIPGVGTSPSGDWQENARRSGPGAASTGTRPGGSFFGAPPPLIAGAGHGAYGGGINLYGGALASQISGIGGPRYMGDIAANRMASLGGSLGGVGRQGMARGEYYTTVGGDLKNPEGTGGWAGLITTNPSGRGRGKGGVPGQFSRW